MKKLLLVGALALFGAMHAQTEKGSWVVSGKTGLAFNSVNTKYTVQGKDFDGPKVNNFNITPSVGYFVMDDLAIGLDLGFTSTKTTFKNETVGVNYEEKTSLFTLLPNATYYFATGSNFRPYLGAGVGYGSLTSTDFYNEKATTKGGLAWGAKGGFVYLLNSTVGLDLGVGYNDFTTKDTVEGTEIKSNASGIGVNAGISVFFK